MASKHAMISKFDPKHLYLTLLCAVALSLSAGAQNKAEAVPKTGKPPVIVIPGTTGSELYDKTTGKQIWFSRSRQKGDDIRLPITPNIAANIDNLEARDIIRGVRIMRILPEVEIYERLIDGLSNRAGYREVKWDEAKAGDHEDTFFVFPYDWRRDNVESARLLIDRIETLKRKLGRPQLKFNVVAHSMGGLVSRYAAMYGDSDIPNGQIRPNWAGAKHFNKVFLIGTPNEGSVSALKALIEGVSYFGSGINIPFVRNINSLDVFTIPSTYQLLPHSGVVFAYNDELQPLPIDLFEAKTWEEYGWDIWNGKKFAKDFTAAEQNNALLYFRAVLARAKRFQEALNANTSAKVPVGFYLMGGDCKETPSGLILRRSEKKDQWITHFKPTDFKTPEVETISIDQQKPLLLRVGDGTVTKESLAMQTISASRPNVLPVAGEIFQCETHGKLVTNSEIQDRLFVLLGAVPEE